MAMGWVWDGAPLSHSHPKIYSYFPSPPKPRAGRGMHSHLVLKQQLKSLPHLILTRYVILKKQDSEWKKENIRHVEEENTSIIVEKET